MVIHDYALREILHRRRMSQGELAEASGVSRATINVICNGKSCKRSTAEKIATALDIELSEIAK